MDVTGLRCFTFDEKFTEGAKIGAGDVIGSVGQTGYAAGPQFRFEVSRDNERLDFLSFDNPTPVLSRNEMKRFQEERDSLVALLRPKEAKPVRVAAAVYYQPTSTTSAFRVLDRLSAYRQGSNASYGGRP